MTAPTGLEGASKDRTLLKSSVPTKPKQVGNVEPMPRGNSHARLLADRIAHLHLPYPTILI